MLQTSSGGNIELLQVREKEIFETLKAIKDFRFVLIGGYAVNTYTLPRFSVDCDIVVPDEEEARKIGKLLQGRGFSEAQEDKNPCKGGFIRYEKLLERGFKVSADILSKAVVDRQTNSSFEAEWLFEHSVTRTLRGKTITEQVRLRIADPDALIVMKCISCRAADIRDVFMLMPQARDKRWIREQIAARYDFNDRFEKIAKTITSQKFKDNLQGVFGFIDERLFDKHRDAVMTLRG